MGGTSAVFFTIPSLLLICPIMSSISTEHLREHSQHRHLCAADAATPFFICRHRIIPRHRAILVRAITASCQAFCPPTLANPIGLSLQIKILVATCVVLEDLWLDISRSLRSPHRFLELTCLSIALRLASTASPLVDRTQSLLQQTVRSLGHVVDACNR